MRTLIGLITWIVIQTTSAFAGEAVPLLEMKVGDQTFQGRLVANDDRSCWLMDRDGRLNELELDRVEAHRVAAPRFRQMTAAELRDQLRLELGNEYEVVGTGHYLVCGKRGQAGRFADAFEDVYRTFHSYFSVRRFPVAEPEFPLVAIVFPDHASFARYSMGQGVTAVQGLKGYYLATSNRVALFSDGDALPAGLMDTIVHETTHQVAFNAGLHSRIGQNPKWVVEGLATVFEAPAIRNSSPNLSSQTRINRDRFVWFGSYAKARRQGKSLESFIGSDSLFERSLLDAYSQSWALTFFLVETRPSQYAEYLKAIAARNPLDDYTAAQRVEDFKKAFGRDIGWLEVELLRFVERLN